MSVMGLHECVILVKSVTMTKKKRVLTSAILVLATAVASAVAIPAASATDTTSVVSARSFPAQKRVSTSNILVESTSVDVSKKSDWGGVESLKISKTDSPAQVAAKKAAAKAAQEAAAQQQAASRSETRTALTGSSSSTSSSSASSSVSVANPTSKSAAALVSYAEQFVGRAPYRYGGTTPSGWDCSGFTMYVFAKFGVSLPHSSGAQASRGTAVASLAQARPGDILANGSHAAIYIGNGMVVNALNPGKGTGISSVSGTFYSSYSIRRLL
jgi:cell wall-associated NlpC family hydrolase